MYFLYPHLSDVFYRKESLLISPRESSTRDSHRILLELSRGVAGQWFQGITSMDSWNNEWFARGMKEYLKYTVAATLVSIRLPLIIC